ncbi:MAG: hypothetical protein HRU15_16420, partial [Planctomycetes bacterium]|nr:hypothetical protein [Planctomycetota bacterium]
EVLHARGKAHWALRFVARKAGAYTWHIEGKDSGGQQLQTEKRKLVITDREHRGFLTIGKNPRYFAFENGDFYYPLAVNLRSPRDEINHDYFKFEFPKKSDGPYVIYEYLQKIQDCGIDMARIWMSPWFSGIEWNADEPGFHGLGVYNLQNAYRLDLMMRRAQKKGILIELALNHHGPFTQRYDSQWKTNPYSTRLGGPASSPAAIMTNEESKSYFKKRLRYIAGRYGAFDTLYAYILWIEANVVDPREPVLYEWHKEFAPYMKKIDAGRHIVTTEFNNNGYPRIWKLPDVEYTQIGGYNFGKGLISSMQETIKYMQPYAKPAVLEEYMGLASGGSMPALAHEFHDGMWAGWMMPLGAAPMPWWWNFIFEKKMDQLYTHFADFIKDEDLSLYEWKYVKNIIIDKEKQVKAMGRLSHDRAFFWVYNDYLSDVKFKGAWRTRKHVFAREYKRRCPNEFSPISAMTTDEDMHFMDLKGASMQVPDRLLEPGTYSVEIWNTWRPAAVQKFEVTIDALPYKLALPHLRKDIAIKLKRKVSQ